MDPCVLSSFSVSYSQHSKKETAYLYELSCCILSTAPCVTIIQHQPQGVYFLCYSWQQSEKKPLPHIPISTGRIVLKIRNQGTSYSFFCNPGVQRTLKQCYRAVCLMEAGVIFSSPCNCSGCQARAQLGAFCRKAVHGKLFAKQFKRSYWTFRDQKQSCCL